MTNRSGFYKKLFQQLGGWIPSSFFLASLALAQEASQNNLFDVAQPVAEIPLKELFFERGQSSLDVKHVSSLKELANSFKGLDIYVLIEAFTDSEGSDESNRKLSLRRADSVAQVLNREQTLSPGRVRIAGYGELFASTTARPEDRRVRITVFRPKFSEHSKEKIVGSLNLRGVETIDRGSPDESSSTIAQLGASEKTTRIGVGMTFSQSATILPEATSTTGVGFSITAHLWHFTPRWMILGQFDSLIGSSSTIESDFASTDTLFLGGIGWVFAQWSRVWWQLDVLGGMQDFSIDPSNTKPAEEPATTGTGGSSTTPPTTTTTKTVEVSKGSRAQLELGPFPVMKIATDLFIKLPKYPVWPWVQMGYSMSSLSNTAYGSIGVMVAW